MNKDIPPETQEFRYDDDWLNEGMEQAIWAGGKKESFKAECAKDPPTRVPEPELQPSPESRQNPPENSTPALDPKSEQPEPSQALPKESEPKSKIANPGYVKVPPTEAELKETAEERSERKKRENRERTQQGAEQKLRENYQPLRPKKLADASRVLPPELISGILYQSRRMLLTGASKSRKSWLLHQMAYSVANGIALLDRFATTKSPVLYVNFELLEAVSALRFDAMKHELGGDQENISIVSVSDHLDLLGPDFSQYLALCAKDYNRKVAVLDPMWRILGSYDENKNSDVRLALAPLVRFSREAQASMIGAHHHTKGSPIGKEAIDRSSGAGAWHRDPAVIWTMTPHRAPECFTINITTNDFPPIEPFVVRFTHPLFVIAPELDPSELRQPPRAKEEEKADQKMEKMLAVLRGADHEGGLSFTEWYNAAGISKATFARKLQELTRSGGPVYKSMENDKYQLSPRYASEWATKMEEEDSDHE